jgi:hypothetical protein
MSSMTGSGISPENLWSPISFRCHNTRRMRVEEVVEGTGFLEKDFWSVTNPWERMHHLPEILIIKDDIATA